MFSFLNSNKSVQDTLKMKKVPYDHQLDALLKMTSRYNEGFLIADDPGLGKTLTCLMLIKIRYRHQLFLKQKGRILHCKPCLVVVPVSAIAIWNKEALDLFPNQDEIYIHYGRKRNEEDHLTLDMIRKTALVITTHNTVQSDGIDILCDKFPLFECVFVDEGHILHGSSALTNTDQSTKRRKKGLSIADSIMALKKRSQVRYVVTGTPFRNEVSDLRLIRYFVDDNFDKETLFYPVEDVEKDAELKNWMNDHMIRRRKEDVLPSLIQQTGSSIGLREKKFFTHSLDFNEFEALNMKNLRQILATRNFANGDKKFVSYKEPVLTNKSMSIWMKMRQCCISYILASKEGQEWINKQHLFLDRPANEEDILKTNDIITKSTKLQRILQDLKKLFDAGDASEKGVGPVVVLISHFVTALKLVDILIKRNASFFQSKFADKRFLSNFFLIFLKMRSTLSFSLVI